VKSVKNAIAERPAGGVGFKKTAFPAHAFSSRIAAPDFTLSVRPGSPALVVIDEG